MGVPPLPMNENKKNARLVFWGISNPDRRRIDLLSYTLLLISYNLRLIGIISRAVRPVICKKCSRWAFKLLLFSALQSSKRRSLFLRMAIKANASHEDNWKTKYNHLDIASYNHSWFVLATWGGGDCGEIYSNMILSWIFQLLKVPTLLIFWWYIMICDNIIIITELGGPQ